MVERSRIRRFGRAVVDRLPRLGAAIGAGLLLCLSFPPFGWWYLAFAAFALLAWVLTRDTTTRWGGFGYGYLFGAAFYLPLLPWVGTFVGPVPWIGLALVQALFPALFGLAAVVVRTLPGWPLWFAGLWTAQEWLKSTVPFGGFPWGVVAYGQTESPLRSIAQLGGAPLVSFAVVLVGFGVGALVFEVIAYFRRAAADAGAPPAVVVPGVCVAAVLLAVALTWPNVRHSGLGAGDEQPVTVAVVQGNVPRLGLDFNAQRRAVLDNHVDETMRLADDVRAGRAPQPMLVIWPENSADIDPLANPDARDLISRAADAIRAPILVGGVVAVDPDDPGNPAATNSVIVWNPKDGPGERHDKQIVQPFGEYLPWRSFFRRFSEYADRAGYFVPGDGTGVVRAAGVPVGVATCWEVIFDRAPREAVRNGAQLLAVPSNNATFTEAMSEQQLAFARLRAVEHDRYVVVAGTTGISAVIAPDGRELVRTAFFEPAYLDTAVRLKTQLTVATRFGPLIEGLLIAVGLGSVIAAILHNGGFVRRRANRDNKDRGAT
ncbi:apolipoprotein N-acyltransferase [Mycolicibacterium phlei]|uniref:apolipoprotein N-acyltransferase n=1 Tax=Mycolicibacterium phlei TaxID=1771 RepID=UPI0007777D77|nr:apolipoprotein N-acyltransferase [Mycolicibacterium phlei]AMO61378.1 Apolipoprotein N-acyltransferase [Mycolicibacterium phlei]STZ18458.1 apolipoprotein N-acyltransferase [Mycolicibacterium phlei]VEG09492.1 apolipoprotein N-acyltransferase [Mycobacteroides chelonae]